jgi:type VI secretion system VasD/TssJ family lipoprotein
LAEKIKALLDYLQPSEGRDPAPKTSLKVTPSHDALGVAGRAEPAEMPSDTGALASAVHVTATTASAVAPHIPGVPASVGMIAAGVASASTAASVSTPAAEAIAPKADSRVTSGDPTLTTQVPVPLVAGSEAPAAAGTRVKAPALGQYADGPSGLSSTEDAAAHAVAGTPIAFKILQLKDDSVLLNADRDLLFKDLKKTLGSSYVDDDDYVLQPGQFKYVEFKKIDRDTRYIAVLANFHDQTSAVWKYVMRVESGGYKYSLLVILKNMDVGMVDESYHQPPRKK